MRKRNRKAAASWGATAPTLAEARRLQEVLRGRNVLHPPLDFAPVLIAGADVSVARGASSAYAAVSVFELETLRRVDEATAEVEISFPYVPGLLTFRELPALLRAWDSLEVDPDVVLIDAHGLAHPRRFGLACHAGLAMSVPSVGCAKSILVGEVGPLETRKGASAPLRIEDEVVGAAVRTRAGVRPVYVSPGYRMDLDTAVDLVLRTAPRYRIPEPIRRSHHLAGARRSASES